jgi:hypothetical protein
MKEAFPRPRKDQKCWYCKKDLFPANSARNKKRDFCWNGLHYFHEKCTDKVTVIRFLKAHTLL